MQFHLEVTPASVLAMVENCGDKLVGGEYIQSEAEIRSKTSERYHTINQLMGTVLEYLHASASVC